MIDFPADWDERAQAFGYDDIHQLYPVIIDSLWHTNVIDVLRAEYPGVNIYSIPTGWAGITLAQMQEDSLLNDDIDLFGASPHPFSPTLRDTRGKSSLKPEPSSGWPAYTVMTLRPMPTTQGSKQTYMASPSKSWTTILRRTSVKQKRRGEPLQLCRQNMRCWLKMPPR